MMTFEEAVKILPTITEYFGWFNVKKGILTLDGNFSMEELEALIVLWKNRDKIKLEDANT